MKTDTRNTKDIVFADLPCDYPGLCGHYLPRPIHSTREYAAAEAVANNMAGYEDSMTEDQKDYFEVLTDFMEDYNEATDPYQPAVSGLEMLKGIMEEHEMSAAALARILGSDRSLGTKILTGERRITADHARVLGEHFKLDPGVFL